MSDADDEQRLVDAAKGANADALGELIGAARDKVYRLALRMVTQPVEAEDATQEILIRVMTRISTFRGEAKFSTWVHRIAVNHLLDRKKSAVERMELTFDLYGEDLVTGLADAAPAADPAAELLATEVRLACTQAMLTCLDRDHRVAYILGEIFEVSRRIREAFAFDQDFAAAGFIELDRREHADRQRGRGPKLFTPVSGHLSHNS